MLATTLVFTAGSFVAAIAPNLPVLLVARFVAGIGDGSFVAVASSTAACPAGSKKAGSAAAVVFGGLTIATNIRVPISTYLGAAFSWRPVLGAISAFGAMGFLGLLHWMRDPVRANRQDYPASALDAIASLFNLGLLSGALVTVFAYAGFFPAYTCIAPVLTDVTGVSSHIVSILTLCYGVLAALGNAAGGKLTVRLGVNLASLTVLAGIALSVLGMWAISYSALSMGIRVALLGMFIFAAVPALQARLIGIVETHAPRAQGGAAGLNFAGFNSGTALGSLLGGMSISTWGVSYTAVTDALLAAVSLVTFFSQSIRNRGSQYKAVRGAGHRATSMY